jgi:HD-like signal output (HDOD) protein
MKKWLGRMFGLLKDGSTPLVAEPGAIPIEETCPNASSASSPVPGQPPIDINGLFYDWLLGCSADAGNTDEALERTILEALERLEKSAMTVSKMVPRMPAVLPQLLKNLRDESVSSNELSRQIAQDLVLVAEVLREVNSSFYNPADKITSLDNAILMLGQNGLRMLIAKVAFRPLINIQSGHFTKMAAPHIWEQSEKCALACRRLAQEDLLDPFQAFLAGLMQQVGLIVAFRVLDRTYQGQTLPHSTGFCRAFVGYARHLSCRIGLEWGFPETMIEAIEEQNDAVAASGRTELGKVLLVGDRLSKMRVLVANAQLQEDDARLRNGLSHSEASCFDALSADQPV